MFENLIHDLEICGDYADPVDECCIADCTMNYGKDRNSFCIGSLLLMAANAIHYLSKRVKELEASVEEYERAGSCKKD